MMIEGNDIFFSYDESKVLKGVGLKVSKGEFIAILGRNGSGKTTLARHLNALLRLQQGSLKVADIKVDDEESIWQLRRIVGMVFQNPDNQFVSSIVEEDIAFGLENYETPREEIPAIVEKSLEQVGMTGYEKHSPHMLSGGQKQRVALAGVLALEPDVLVFDESTSMLDPEGRREVLAMIESLHRAGKTIIMITHYVEETVGADRIIVMDGGQVIAEGKPCDVLSDSVMLKSAGLLPPVAVRIYNMLAEKGIKLARCPLSGDELVEEICQSM